MDKSFSRLHAVVKSYVVVFVIWGLYRLVFRLPEVVEETLLKPLVFVGTVFLIERPKKWDKFFLSVWGSGDWIRAFFLGLSGGLAYVIFYGWASFLAFGKLELGSEPANELWASFMGLGILTAVWEEWLFTGYIFSRLRKVMKGFLAARLATALLFALIHIPILAFGYKFTGPTLVFQLVLLLALGFANTLLVGISRNLLAPVLAHALWGVAIFLFR